MGIIRFLKDWTLPVAIATGTVCYLLFYYVPALDEVGNALSPIFDVLFPVTVFMTLFVTFCKVDFHQMRPHRWHTGILIAQLLLVAVVVGVILTFRQSTSKLFWEALLTCIIGPSASAAPVVVGKLGGNISTMTTYTLISSLASALHSGEGFLRVASAFGIRLDHAALREGCLRADCRYAQSEFLLLGCFALHYYRYYGEEYRTQFGIHHFVAHDSLGHFLALLGTVRHRKGHR